MTEQKEKGGGSYVGPSRHPPVSLHRAPWGPGHLRADPPRGPRSVHLRPNHRSSHRPRSGEEARGLTSRGLEREPRRRRLESPHIERDQLRRARAEHVALLVFLRLRPVLGILSILRG